MLPELDLDLEWRGKRYQDVDRGLRAIAVELEGDVQKMLPIARKTLNVYMKGVVGSVRQRISTPFPSGTSPLGEFPGRLSRRSGGLLRQFTNDRVKVSGSSKEVAVQFTLSGIAAVHERGATIRPKRAKYLTVPLPAALDRRGVPLKQSARDWQNTFVQKSKRGNLLIFRKVQGGGIVPLYVLKKSVTIPKRLAFEPAFEAGLNFLADKLAADILREFQSGT